MESNWKLTNSKFVTKPTDAVISCCKCHQSNLTEVVTSINEEFLCMPCVLNYVDSYVVLKNVGNIQNQNLNKRVSSNIAKAKSLRKNSYNKKRELINKVLTNKESSSNDPINSFDQLKTSPDQLFNEFFQKTKPAELSSGKVRDLTSMFGQATIASPPTVSSFGFGGASHKAFSPPPTVSSFGFGGTSCKAFDLPPTVSNFGFGGASHQVKHQSLSNSMPHRFGFFEQPTQNNFNKTAKSLN